MRVKCSTFACTFSVTTVSRISDCTFPAANFLGNIRPPVFRLGLSSPSALPSLAPCPLYSALFARNQRHLRRRPARYGRAAESRREGNPSSPQAAEVARHFNLRRAGLRTRGVGPAPACSGRRRGGWRGSDQRHKRRGWPLRRPPRRTVTDAQSWAFGECFLT